MIKALQKSLYAWILGGITLLFSIGTIASRLFDTGRLSSFGPLASQYFFDLQSGIFRATVILAVCLIISLLARKNIEEGIETVRTMFYGSTQRKQAFAVLICCFIFAFSIHHSSVLHGYFLNDDFEVINVGRQYDLGRSLFVPHGDHTIPLFRVEMSLFSALFGQNPLPYNVAVFAVFALVPFFTYLIFRRSKIGLKPFIVFLVAYTAAINWADILTGYYTISIYLQISLFFAISLWSYLGWMQTKGRAFLVAFSLSLAAALTVDISGIWTIPAIGMSMLVLHEWKGISRISSIKSFISDNKATLFALLAVCSLFLAFMLYNFHLSGTETFTTTTNNGGVPLLKYFTDVLAFIGTGLTQTLLLPTVVKILVHPSLHDRILPLWFVFDLALVAFNIFIGTRAYRAASSNIKKMLVLTLAALFINILIIIIKRPLTDFVFDADLKYVAMPYYFYCLFISLCTAAFMQAKKISFKTVAAILIVIFSIQQSLNFEAAKKVREGTARGAAIEHFGATFFEEIAKIPTHGKPLSIPNLVTNSIYREAGATLADYILFFNVPTDIHLVENSAMRPDTKTGKVELVSSLRTATDPAFIEALKNPSILRTYYLSPMNITFSTTSANTATRPSLLWTGTSTLSISTKKIDPEKNHLVVLQFETDAVPGNLEFALRFANDFKATEPLGVIRIDDGIPSEAKGDRRIYTLKFDMLQLYPYALSKTVSNITLEFQHKKDLKIVSVELQ